MNPQEIRQHHQELATLVAEIERLEATVANLEADLKEAAVLILEKLK